MNERGPRRDAGALFRKSDVIFPGGRRGHTPGRPRFHPAKWGGPANDEKDINKAPLRNDRAARGTGRPIVSITYTSCSFRSGLRAVFSWSDVLHPDDGTDGAQNRYDDHANIIDE